MEEYKEDLKNLKRLILELNQTNSTTDKKKVLKRHPECKKILYYTYNPFRQFYVTSDNLKKNSDLVEEPNDLSLYELLDTLAEREITGHQAIAVTNGFIKQNPAFADIILRIIDRNLKTRTDAKLINKVWPGLVPSFDVALAQKFDDYADKIDFRKDDWYASRKIDGCVSGDSIVELEDGTTLTIRKLVEDKIEKKIKSYNEKNKKVEFKKITAYIKNGIDINETFYQWYNIELENGISLKLTGNHRVYLPDLKCYRRVDELNGDEYLLLDI